MRLRDSVRKRYAFGRLALAALVPVRPAALEEGTWFVLSLQHLQFVLGFPCCFVAVAAVIAVVVQLSADCVCILENFGGYFARGWRHCAVAGPFAVLDIMPQ